MGMVVKLAQSVRPFFLFLALPYSVQALTYIFQIRLACVSNGSFPYPRTFADHYFFSDRDSGKWNLDPEQTQKRRNLFYELLTYDSWQVSWNEYYHQR
jgi:hypothetical protein